MDADIEVNRLLAECGAVLVRNKKHEVWKLPNGGTFTRAATPSDHRAHLNQLTDLRRELGIVDPERGKPGERRQRKVKATPPPRCSAEPTGGGVLAEKLMVTGVLEKRLRAEIEELKSNCGRCWWCRFKQWWQEPGEEKP